MIDMEYTELEPPAVYPDEMWDPEREGGWQGGEPAERGFARGRVLDGELASPFLAMTVTRTAEADLAGLSGNELLGAVAAAERVAGHYAWAAGRLAAECARRQLTWDPQLGQEVIPEFGEADYAQEILLSPMAARGNLTRSQVSGQMPECATLAYQGLLSPYRQRVIAEEAGVLDPALLAEADKLIAAGAAGRTPGSLRNFCRKVVFTLDPQQAEERRKKATKGRRIEFGQEQSGNAMIVAHELAIAVAAAIKQALSGWARIMRAAGIEGSMDNLRTDAMTALLLGRHPVTGAAAFTSTGTGAPAPSGPWDGATPADQDPDEQAEDPDAAHFNPWGFGDYEPGTGTEAGPSAAAGAAPVVNFHLILTEGTLDPETDAPGFIPGWGWITGAAARDLVTAGSANPASRWCVTETDSQTGEAVRHGCARGPHRWTPGDGGHSRDGPPATGPPASGITGFIASLHLVMEPIARHPGDDGHREPGHDPSRKLTHLITARNATCATPGCDASAFFSDMEHRIPYDEGGETSEHNIDPGHRHCHRLKQHKDWKVVKTGPAETQWTGPSGRTRIVRPTRYL
jgi:hypothetical protein